MVKPRKPRTVFLPAIMAITVSMALTALTAPVPAASATAGGRASAAAAGTSNGPALKFVAQPATVAVTTGYTGIASLASVGANGILSPDQCLSTYEGLNDEFAVKYFCDENNAQEWAIGREWGSTGFYQLINKNGQCLGVSGASKAAGAIVVGWNCLPTHPDQYWGWYLVAGNPNDNNAEYAIRDLNSGYFLTVFQDLPGNNTLIDQEPWQRVDWQVWFALGS